MTNDEIRRLLAPLLLRPLRQLDEMSTTKRRVLVRAALRRLRK